MVSVLWRFHCIHTLIMLMNLKGMVSISATYLIKTLVIQSLKISCISLSPHGDEEFIAFDLNHVLCMYGTLHYIIKDRFIHFCQVSNIHCATYNDHHLITAVMSSF